MKYLLILLVFILTSCNEEFSRSYDKIDGEFPRMVSMYFVDPDFAPGDTVTLRSHWAGQKINYAEIEWEVAWSYFQNEYGNDVIGEIESLEPFIVPGSKREVTGFPETQIFEMEMVIPEDFLENSPGIPDNLNELIERYSIVVSAENIDLPMDISLDKKSLLGLLDSLSQVPADIQAQFPDSLAAAVEGIAQMMSADFRLFCDYSSQGGFRGYLTYPVRYHSKLDAMSGVYTNNRIQQTSATVYRVDGEVYSFDPDNTPVVAQYDIVDDSVSFPYDESDSYFWVQTFAQRDSCLTIQQAFSTRERSFEKFDEYWFTDKLGFEMIGMSNLSDDADREAGTPRLKWRMNFGESNKIRKDVPLTYWLETKDRRFGVTNRPVSRDCREYHITLK